MHAEPSLNSFQEAIWEMTRIAPHICSVIQSGAGFSAFSGLTSVAPTASLPPAAPALDSEQGVPPGERLRGGQGGVKDSRGERTVPDKTSV